MKGSGKVKRILLTPLPNWLGYVTYTIAAIICLFMIYVVYSTITGTQPSLLEKFLK